MDHALIMFTLSIGGLAGLLAGGAFGGLLDLPGLPGRIGTGALGGASGGSGMLVPAAPSPVNARRRGPHAAAATLTFIRTPSNSR